MASRLHLGCEAVKEVLTRGSGEPGASGYRCDRLHKDVIAARITISSPRIYLLCIAGDRLGEQDVAASGFGPESWRAANVMEKGKPHDLDALHARPAERCHEDGCMAVLRCRLAGLAIRKQTS